MKDADMNGLWARLAPWTATALLALAATWLTGRLVALHHENESLRTERLLAEVAYKTGQNQLAERSLLAENMINSLAGKLRRAENLSRLKVSTLASPAGHTPESRAIVVWDPDQQTGLLTVEQLPPLAPDQDYQIWVIDPAYPSPVDGGVFHHEAGGGQAIMLKPSRPVGEVSAFMVTIERKGATKAGGPVVLRGN